MKRSRARLAALAALAVPTAMTAAMTAALTGAMVPATAAPADTEPTATVATNLYTPYSIAASDDGTLWFSNTLAGGLERQTPGQDAVQVYRKRNHQFLDGISVGAGQVWFTLAGHRQTLGRLMSISTSGGDATQVADLGAYEAAHNPDSGKRYGLRGLSSSCASKVADSDASSYGGKVHTDPTATLHEGHHTYVVDSGANDLLKVKNSGKIKTVTVFSAVRTTVDAAYAAEHKLPDCTVGATYRAEATPTDVVAGPGHTLYVTTRGGGPAAEGGQSAGALYAVNDRTGKKTKLVSGLTTPTGLTLAPSGDLYVAELFGNQIVRIPAGGSTAVPFAQVPYPGDVLATPTRGLLATVNVLSGTSGKAGDPVNGRIERFAY